MTLPAYAMNQASFPELYEQYLAGPLFRPWAEFMLEEIGLSAGDRVLDIACGTGVVARVARERLGSGGNIVGVDVSPGMLAVASAVAPDIDWREGDAAALPLREGEQFDVVTCQQGLQFFPDRQGAAGEMRRALKTDGRLAVAVWRSDQESPFLRELRRVAEGRLGPIADQRYSFGPASVLEALLRGAGFNDVRVRTVSRTLRFSDGAPFLRLNAMAFVGMSAAGRDLDEEGRKRTVEAIASESEAVLAAYTDESGLAFALSANLATARG